MEFVVNIHGEKPNIARRVLITNGTWFVPEELPIAFVFNRRNYAVMMGTPNDLVDFALGFSLTEGIIKTSSEIKSIDIHLSEKGVDFRIKITNEALERLDITQRRRNIVGSASCGLCGLENADTLFKTLPRVSDVKMKLEIEAISIAMSNMGALQYLNQKTHSVHAAAWVTLGGEIKLIREDVGRHNALDKLLGAMVLANESTASGFVLMSSRCSYEIVEKAAYLGVKSIVSISGPTAFALSKAKEANMSIYSHSENGPIEVMPET